MPAAAPSFSLQSIAGSVREKAQALDLVIYWRSIAKRKWMVFGIGLVAALAAAVLVNFQTPIYRSTAILLIEQQKAKVAPTEEVYAGVGDSREHFLTQAEILKSAAVAGRVVDKLELSRHGHFDPRQQEPPLLYRLKKQLGLVVTEPQWNETRLRQAALKAVTSRTTVEPLRLSQLIKVHFESPDPVTAAEIANAIAKAYIESDKEARAQIHVRANEWLGARLSGLKKDLAESERALQQYRDRVRLVNVRGLAQSGASREIEDLVTRLVAARERRLSAEHAYNQIRDAKGRLEVLPVVMSNPLVQRLRELENDAEKRVTDLSGRYGPEHPRMIHAQAELRQARDNTRREVETVAGSLANEYELARENEKALERAVAQAKATVQNINRKEFELAALERAVANNRQIYDLFLTRFRETRAARDLDSTAIARVSDEARPAHHPVKPRKEELISLAFVLGIVLGALIALLLERLDNTLKSADDVEEKVGEPVLTTLPLLKGRQAKTVGRHYLEDDKSVFSEAVRTARTGILLASAGKARVTVLVTSSVPGEGKTAVAVNLALAQAQSQRVLLIDADLRQPAVAKTLGLDASRPGLTDLLCGSAQFAECLQRVDGTSLYSISAGAVPPNPLELMLTKRFEALVKALAGACDFLVIDSPPVHLVSDALVLSKMATGVVFVVRAGSTPYPLVRRCIRAVHEVEAPLFGIALNQLDLRKAEKYYGGYAYDKYHYATPARNPLPALHS